MIQFTKETCGDLDAALRREWLETNGLGGFASSTIVGLNTRRYHGENCSPVSSHSHKRCTSLASCSWLGPTPPIPLFSRDLLYMMS